ncbi:MAG: hypothetical protein L6V90_12650 [Treponema succinifaciens]|nr:MAG: hypothetical protein L6V90_12650 [Treponema succinifaciens]
MSRVGGIGLKEIDEDVNFHHNKAFDPLGLAVNTHLDSVGNHKLRRGPTCEDHLYSPETIIALQESTRTGSYERFRNTRLWLTTTRIPTPCAQCSSSVSRKEKKSA